MLDLCACHGEPVVLDGNRVRCRTRRLASRARYESTDRARARKIRWETWKRPIQQAMVAERAAAADLARLGVTL